MKVRDLMTKQVIRIHPMEPVSVAARTLEQYNIGMLPVCGKADRVCGVVTDRDLVTRCIAAGRRAEETLVRDVMTTGVLTADPDMVTEDAAKLMGKAQVRRLPVLENGRLCGVLSMGDLTGNGNGDI